MKDSKNNESASDKIMGESLKFPNPEILKFES